MLAHENCSGASTRVPVTRAALAHRQQRRGRFGEQRLTDRLARRPRRIERGRAHVDAGGHVPQQRGPRAVPAHRERARSRAAAARRAPRGAGRATRPETRAAARSRRASSRTSAARVSPSTPAPGAAPRRAPGAHRRRAHIAIASSSKPHASSAANASADGGASRRSARAASTSDCSGSGSSVRMPRSSIRSQRAVDRVGVGERRHVDIGPGRRARPRTVVRCGTGNTRPCSSSTAPGRARQRRAPIPPSTPASTHARRRRRTPTAIASGESFSTSITTMLAVAVADRVDALDRVAAGDAQRGVHDRRGVRAATAARPARRGPAPASRSRCGPATRSRERALVHGAVGVDLGRDAGRQRADADHRATRHRMPWSSGFALRNISSGTRSAGPRALVEHTLRRTTRAASRRRGAPRARAPPSVDLHAFGDHVHLVDDVVERAALAELDADVPVAALRAAARRDEVAHARRARRT